jgi:hypothetical protein
MLSPETIQLMAQTYEEWMQDPSALSRPLETMKWAYQKICAGEDPWTGLGSFSHAWYGYAKGRRAALVSEPLVKPERETEYTRRWGSFCAASVEFLCDRYDIPCPDWVHDPSYTLATPWWHTGQADDPSIREHLLHMTPIPFARRNIFCTNRLFQNKYEMYEWTQEARAKGITDPGEIWRYARDREISIHGA